MLGLPVSISSVLLDTDIRIEAVTVGSPRVSNPNEVLRSRRTGAAMLLDLFLHDRLIGLDKIHGAYAAVIVDGRDGRIYLLRDRFGFVPLFYSRKGEVMFCSTSLRLIVKAAGIEPKINPAGLLRYYLFHYVVPPLTIYREIQQPAPGHCFILSDSSLTVRRHTSFSKGKRRKQGEREMRRELSETITRAVVEESSDSRSLSIALSGGLDSSVIAAALPKDRKRRARAFTLRPARRALMDDDLDALAGFCRQNELDLTSLYFDGRDFALLPRFLAASQEPVCVFPLFYLFLLLRGASGLTQRMLLGEGGDELFLGYRHQIQLMRSFIARQLGGLKNGCGSLRRERLIPRLARLEVSLGWSPPDDVIEQALACLPEEPTSPDINGFLDALIEQELTCFPYFFMGTRLGAFWGIDVRCPLLHPAVVEAAFSLSWETLVTAEAQAGLTKAALRNAFRAALPGELLARPKEGFGESWNEHNALTRQFGGCATAAKQLLEAAGLEVAPNIRKGINRMEGEAADLFWHDVFLGIWLASASDRQAQRLSDCIGESLSTAIEASP